MAKQESEAWQRFQASLPPELAALHAQPPADVLATPDGRMVSVEELVAVLREQTTPPPQTPERSLRPERRGAGLIAEAWRHATHRQALAVLALFDAGLAVEAQANARVCLEHAVMLQRLGLAADAGELDSLLLELAQEQQRRQGRVLEYLDGLDTLIGGPHRGLLSAVSSEHQAQVSADKTRPETRTVRGHFLSVPEGVHLYSVYSRLSEQVHAGLVSAVPYVLPAMRDGEPVSADPEPVPLAETLALLCWSCCAAEDAMRRFLVRGDEFAARHLALMRRIGLISA